MSPLWQGVVEKSVASKMILQTCCSIQTPVHFQIDFIKEIPFMTLCSYVKHTSLSTGRRKIKVSILKTYWDKLSFEDVALSINQYFNQIKLLCVKKCQICKFQICEMSSLNNLSSKIISKGSVFNILMKHKWIILFKDRNNLKYLSTFIDGFKTFSNIYQENNK